MLWVILVSILNGAVDTTEFQTQGPEQALEILGKTSETIILEGPSDFILRLEAPATADKFGKLKLIRNDRFVTRYRLALKKNKISGASIRQGFIAFRVPSGTHQYRIETRRMLKRAWVSKVNEIPMGLRRQPPERDRSLRFSGADLAFVPMDSRDAVIDIEGPQKVLLKVWSSRPTAKLSPAQLKIGHNQGSLDDTKIIFKKLRKHPRGYRYLAEVGLEVPKGLHTYRLNVPTPRLAIAATRIEQFPDSVTLWLPVQAPGHEAGTTESPLQSSSEDESAGFGEGLADEWENFVGDDALGFGAGSTLVSSATESKKTSPLSIIGSIRSSSAFWLEQSDPVPAKARQALDLSLRYRGKNWRLQATAHAEYDFAYLMSPERYDRPTQEIYQWDVNSRELIAAISLGNFELSVGRQIVAWGEGMLLSPLDVVNPRDNREPGQAALEDIRLPLLSTRLGWFYENHRVELLLNHEVEWGYRPAPLSPFSPVQQILEGSALGQIANGRDFVYSHRQKRFDMQNQEAFLRWQYTGDFMDLSFYGASLLDRQGTFDIDPNTMLSSPSSLTLGLDHRRYWMVGHSAVLPVADWTIRWEAGLELNRSANTGSAEQLGTENLHIMNLMTSVSYGGIDSLNITLEIWKPFALNPLDNLFYDLEQTGTALLIGYTALREKLQLNAAAMVIGLSHSASWTARMDVKYSLEDDWKVGLGVITYQPGKAMSPFSGLTRHDQILIEASWDFQIY
jgi:hypothetical protein